MKVMSGPGDLSIRFTQIAFTVAGILLLAAAVYELAGARAALLAGWVATLEPSSVFFASMAQKESLAMLGEGLLALGCARAWRRTQLRSLVTIAAGAVVIAGARPYAGLFAALGGGAVVTVALIRALPPARRPRTGIAVTAVIALGVAAVLVTPQGHTELGKLARFQQEGAINSRLELEPVDFSTASGIVVGLPKRIRDYLLKPYPWQQQDASQRLAAIPTLLAWLLLALALASLFKAPGVWLRRAPPLALPALLVTLGYALTTANAGTGFRHRTHLLFLLAGLVAIVWSDSLPSAQAVPRLIARRFSQRTQDAVA